MSALLGAGRMNLSGGKFGNEKFDCNPEFSYDLPTTELERVVMPDMMRELADRLVKGAMVEKEKLAKRLIDAGYNPEYVTIGERWWYDEETYSMKYECFPITKGVEPPGA